MPKATKAYTEIGAPVVADDEDFIGALGDYDLIRKIGKGGMGVVFEAEQRGLNRRVAVKLLPSALLADEDTISRFRREAETAAAIDHPNIVSIYEVGEEDGQPFIAMQLIEGGSLSDERQQLQGKPRPVVELVSKIAKAAHAAHQRGILHRDLKPGNILIDADSGEPFVSDFGLAKRFDDEGLTLTGQVLGTPGYMAPEQAGGREITAAADVYGLGAVLYDLLTGRAPFAGGNVAQVIRQIEESNPAAPGSTTKGIDRDLDAIALKCLEKEPKHRYSSAAELANDLDRWLRREPIMARQISKTQRMVRWARRQPFQAGLAGLGALFVLTLAIGGPLVALNQTRLRQEADDARLEVEIEQRKLRHRAYAHDMTFAGMRLGGYNSQGGIQRALAPWEPDNFTPEDDFHGWEWDFLKTNSINEQECVFQLDSYSINGFDFGMDGQRMVLATNSRVFLISTEDGDPIWDVNWSPGGRDIVVSANERFFAVVNDNSEVAIGNLETGAEVWRKPTQSRGNHRGFRWSPKGELLAYFEKNGELRVLDAERAEVVAEFPGKQEEKILAFDWMPDGRTMLLGFANRIEMWPIGEDGVEKIYTSDSELKIMSVAVSPDGSRAAFGYRDGDERCGIDLFDLEERKFTEFMDAPEIDQQRLTWRSDGKRLAASGVWAWIPARIWQFGDETSVSILNGLGSNVLWGTNHEIYQQLPNKIVKRRTPAPINQFQAFKTEDRKYMIDLSWSPDGQQLLVVGAGVFAVEVSTHDFVVRKYQVDGFCHAVRWAADGKSFVIWVGEEIFEAPTDLLEHDRLDLKSDARLIHRHFADRIDVRLELLEDPPRVISRHRSDFSVTDLRTLEQAYQSDRTSHFAIHPKNSMSLVTKMHNEQFLEKTNLETGESENLWALSAEEHFAYDFHPDGAIIAINHWDVIDIWSYPEGESIAELTAHDYHLHQVKFSPDGSRLATSALDESVRIWNPEHGTEVLTLKVEGGRTAIAWSPDGKSLAALNEYGMLRIWRAGK